jgi:hypothetical protein
MDAPSPSPADQLPGLYRAILDRVAEFEGRGERAEAARMRSAAIRIYSRSWDEGARRALEEMLRRSVRPGAGDVQRPGLLRRPAVAP